MQLPPRPTREQLRLQLRLLAPPAASRQHARRLYLYGSLLWGGQDPAPVPELAVEGLTAEAAEALGAELRELLDPPPRLLRLEDAPPLVSRAIRDRGELLFDALQ